MASDISFVAPSEGIVSFLRSVSVKNEEGLIVHLTAMMRLQKFERAKTRCDL